MFKRIYLEITNVCNLSCSFCPGTQRPAHFLTIEEFTHLAEKLRAHTEYLYFHLMGEPLVHPAPAELLAVAESCGFRVNITTNGTLLSERGSALLSAPAVHRVNISLQSWEANRLHVSLYDYVNSCAAFSRSAAARGILVSLRLWNGGGADTQNGAIIDILRSAFPPPWQQGQKNTVLSERIFLETANMFDWPDPDADEENVSFCRGLRDHIGILCDGTVVPCCLDSEGRLALGNLFNSTLDEILGSPRARAIYEGFSRRVAAEPLCRRCGYASRF